MVTCQITLAVLCNIYIIPSEAGLYKCTQASVFTQKRKGLKFCKELIFQSNGFMSKDCLAKCSRDYTTDYQSASYIGPVCVRTKMKCYGSICSMILLLSFPAQICVLHKQPPKHVLCLWSREIY